MLVMLTLLLFTSGVLLAQKTISGKVTDEKGDPIANASVVVKGSSAGTTSNEEGSFTLTVPANAKTIVISAVGFTAKEIALNSQSSYAVSLAVSSDQMDEVVVIGYQSISKTAGSVGALSVVKGEELAQKPIGSFTQLLQGKATGVQVVGQSGRPGSNGYIRVRGTGSINASNEPLILLDGVPIQTQAYNMLNPNDIADLTILKDASAQSIYGSRAANGVIVITSKIGSSRGKPNLSYAFQYGTSKAQDLKNVQLMNAREKLQYEFEARASNRYLDSMIANRVASGAFPTGSTLFTITEQQRLALWDLLESRGAGNWDDYFLQTGRLARHELSLSGGADKFKYYLSLNRTENKGVVYGTKWNTTGGRLNIEYKAMDWIKIGTRIGVNYSDEMNVRNLNNTQSAYQARFSFNPYEPYYLQDGKTWNPGIAGFNPIEGTERNPALLMRLSTFGTGFAEINLMKDLVFKSQIGVNYNTLRSESYLQPGSNLATILGYNQKADGGNSDFVFVFTNTLNWKKTFASRHSINVLAGQEYTKDQFYSYSLTARGLPSASFITLENGTPFGATTSRSDWSLISYFGNVTYEFDKKYSLKLTGRRDGSSRFGANQKFANFWAVGASWDVKKESFLANVNVLSDLKLRASIGTSGTVPTGLYDNLGTYSASTKYLDVPAYSPARLASPDLTWEQNQNYDIGLDFALFNNRINGSVDYYNRKSKNLIYGKNVSATTGFSSFTSNIGSVGNKGIELSLNGDVVRTKDLNINLFATFSRNKNEILELFSDNVPQTLSRFKVGQSLFTYYMVRWVDVNPETGKNRYLDINGNYTDTYKESDAVLLDGKSPLAKFFGSFGTNANYKGFDLSVNFYYTGGNYISNWEYLRATYEGGGPQSVNKYTESFDYWKKPGDIAKFANINDATQRTSYTTSTKYLEKGDYINLRDVVLGYTLPTSISQKVRISSLRVYVQGTNLWIGTKFRGIPEVGEANNESTLVSPGLYNLYAQPQLRALTAGVQIQF